MVRLVSDNSDRELAKRRAEEQLQSHVAPFVANLLRVIRGACRSYELSEQIILLANAISEATEAGVYPGNVLAKELDCWRPDSFDQRLSACDRRWRYAETAIIAGALQIVASRAVEQLTQERAGESEMIDGVIAIDAIREENRKEFMARTPRPAIPNTRANKAGSPGKRSRPEPRD